MSLKADRFVTRMECIFVERHIGIHYAIMFNINRTFSRRRNNGYHSNNMIKVELSFSIILYFGSKPKKLSFLNLLELYRIQILLSWNMQKC